MGLYCLSSFQNLSKSLYLTDAFTLAGAPCFNSVNTSPARGERETYLFSVFTDVGFPNKAMSVSLDNIIFLKSRINLSICGCSAPFKIC